MAEDPLALPVTRRQVLALGLAGGAALLTGCSPTRPRRRALTAAPTTCPRPAPAAAPGALGSVEHVVVLIQENRSFDHYFGSYRGVRGFDDHLSSSPGVFAQSGVEANTGDGAGHLLPFHLDTATTNAACTNDITHAWGAQHRSWNGGAMDGFVRVHEAEDGSATGPLTMGYYSRADLQYFYALADAFTICDAYHCSVLGPTGPNRVYSMTATLDPEGLHGGPIVTTEGLDTATRARFSRTWTTMPERLQSQGVSWKVYQQPGIAENPLAVAISNNPLFYFRQFADPSSPLHQLAFLPSYPDDFRRDVAAGTLPSVSWVLTPLGQDEHPPASPQVGEFATSQVLATLVSNPAVWAKTVLFITYDENGGFFDHVAPPTAPPGTPGEYVTAQPAPADLQGVDGPIGLGFRVPLLVASPFSRGGFVCSDRFDHTSLLRFLETRFGVEVPNLSAWRRSMTGDLTTALDLRSPDFSVPPLPATSLSDPVVQRECPANEIIAPVGPYPVPPTPSLPHQEPGTARRRSGAC